MASVNLVFVHGLQQSVATVVGHWWSGGYVGSIEAGPLKAVSAVMSKVTGG